MNKHKAIILLIIMTTAGVSLAEQPAASVKIFLPSSKIVVSANITLDDIAHISGMDMKMTERARAVKLGRAPFPGEKITLSSKVILAQLASAGIYEHDIQLVGAKSVRLRRESNTIASGDFVNAAQDFIKSRLSGQGVTWELAHKPAVLAILGKGKVNLRCSEIKGSGSGRFGVIVRVISKTKDKKILGERKVFYKLKYQTQRAVATREIAAGEVVTSENAKIEAIVSPRKPVGVALPLGLKARKTIQSGAVITQAMVITPKPAVLVKRNRTVRVKVVGPTWKITTLGIALQNGRAGETIRVRNIESKRVIFAKIDKHGDVVPMMNKNMH